MNLLIIGNGFDLAHNLPTRYTDFLRCCRDYKNGESISESGGINKEFLSFIDNNVWLQYFLSLTVDLDNPRTWIDFEKEVAEVINDLDVASPVVEQAHYLNAPSEITLRFLKNSESKKLNLLISSLSIESKTEKYIIANNDIGNTKALINYLYSQFHIFARAFEIYCLSINTIQLDKTIITTERKSQIEKAKSNVEHYAYQARQASGYASRKNDVAKFEKLRDEASNSLCSLTTGIRHIDYLGMSKFDYVLSFNYTNTYERLYGNKDTQYCYIHGKAQNEAANTNIIFGIDDDLTRGEESKNFKWIKFKKYYQRIIFRADSKYKEWLNPSSKHGVNQDYVHIVGHSLDKTDYDVLYEIFDNSQFRILVYYYCFEDFEDKVQKVIQLLACRGRNGRDELIRRVHGIKWSIKFINQYDETDGLFIKHEDNLDQNGAKQSQKEMASSYL